MIAELRLLVEAGQVNYVPNNSHCVCSPGLKDKPHFPTTAYSPLSRKVLRFVFRAYRRLRKSK